MSICVEYYSDDKYQYSTALMFAYITPTEKKNETNFL
jgi:hypothetical protein